MGRAIIVGAVIILLALIYSALYIYIKRHAARQDNLRAGLPVKGDLSRRTEGHLIAKLDSAAQLFQNISTSTSHLEGDFLTERSQANVATWLESYRQLRKELERA